MPLSAEETLKRSAVRASEWRKRNPGKNLEAMRRWREKNPEKSREISKAWREKNIDRAKATAKAYRARHRALSALRNYIVISDEARSLAEASKNGCKYCGSFERIEVDHKIPRSRGGLSGDISNLQWLCRKCNHAKGAMTEEEFFEHVEILYHKRFVAGL